MQGTGRTREGTPRRGARAASSIQNLAEALARDRVADISATNIYRLAHFYDEHPGHSLFHAGVPALDTLLVYREWWRLAGIAAMWWATIVAGLI